jgi:DNA-binding MarR family transcriptional regulator
MDCQNRLDFLQNLAKEIPELDVLSVEPLLHLLRTSDGLYVSLNQSLSQVGLSTAKIKMLMLLYKNLQSGLSPSVIAEKIGVTRGTITGLLDGLERDGRIERITSKDDRRMLVIKLTESGLNLIYEVLPKHFLYMSNLMSQLSLEDKQNLSILLQKIDMGMQSR